MLKQALGAIGVLALFLSVLFVGCSCRTVPAGHVGVVTTFGKVDKETVGEGIHFMNPLKSVNILSLQVQKSEGQFASATQDMQNVHVNMALNYHLRASAASEVFQKIGPDYYNKIVVPAAQEVLKAETAKHKASEILHKRQEIKADVQASIATWLGKYGIELVELSISNVGFDSEYAQAIEQKQIQEQEAAKRVYQLTVAQREAEIAQAKAKGEADAAREAAKGRADAMRVEGEALADYNRKVAASLTDVLIQSEYLKRWDGKLPTMTTGGNTLFQIPAPGRN